MGSRWGRFGPCTRGSPSSLSSPSSLLRLRHRSSDCNAAPYSSIGAVPLLPDSSERADGLLRALQSSLLASTEYDIRPQLQSPPLPLPRQRSEVSLVTVNAIANNRTKRVDLATLDALRRVLRVEPGALLERVSERKGKRG